MLSSNPDIYTLWNIRRETLLASFEYVVLCPMWCRLLTWCDRGSSDEAKQSLCNAELELTTSCLMVNPKSYGAWQQVTVAHLKAAAAHTLMSRPQQRIWVMGNAPTAPWAAELALCTKFLSADTRNCAYAVSPCHAYMNSLACSSLLGLSSLCCPSLCHQ